MENLTDIVNRALEAIEASDSLTGLDNVRVEYLGKKGALTQRLKQLGKLPAEERPRAGQVINAAKGSVQDAINTRKSILENAELDQALESEPVRNRTRCEPPRHNSRRYDASRVRHP